MANLLEAFSAFAEEKDTVQAESLRTEMLEDILAKMGKDEVLLNPEEFASRLTAFIAKIPNEMLLQGVTHFPLKNVSKNNKYAPRGAEYTKMQEKYPGYTFVLEDSLAGTSTKKAYNLKVIIYDLKSRLSYFFKEIVNLSEEVPEGTIKEIFNNLDSNGEIQLEFVDFDAFRQLVQIHAAGENMGVHVAMDNLEQGRYHIAQGFILSGRMTAFVENKASKSYTFKAIKD